MLVRIRESNENHVDQNVIWLVTVEPDKSCDTISFIKLYCVFMETKYISVLQTNDTTVKTCDICLMLNFFIMSRLCLSNVHVIYESNVSVICILFLLSITKTPKMLCHVLRFLNKPDKNKTKNILFGMS